MIQELKDVNTEYMDKGIGTELVIESADTDVAGQIQQLQNLMSKGVDAILVNPGDVNGLNDTLQEAVKKGILVISVDQELATPSVYNVGINQKEWAKTSAKWLAEKLGGKGDIVQIEGFPGHPANVARMDGVAEVLKGYPDIKVLATESGKWDEATGQQVMSNFLAAFPNLNGYWTQDGMAIGAMQALLAANPAKLPVVVGEGRCQFLQLWNEQLAKRSKLRVDRCGESAGRVTHRLAHCLQYAARQASRHEQVGRRERHVVCDPGASGGDQGQLQGSLRVDVQGQAGHVPARRHHE